LGRRPLFVQRPCDLPQFPRRAAVSSLM
jgi:hypothetical protein